MINLNYIPIIDHHAHSLSDIEYIETESQFIRWFTESNNPKTKTNYVKNTVFFHLLMKELAQFFNCEKNINAILERRNSFTNENLIKLFFKELNIKHVFCDCGIPFPKSFTINEQAMLTECEYSEILRIETLAEKFINETENFDLLLSKYITYIENGIKSQKWASLKSIIAYRSGLIISNSDYKIAVKDFIKFKNSKSVRLGSNYKNLLDFLFFKTLEITESLNFPFQIHTGFGDNDLNISKSNPAHLTNIFKTHKKTKFVLLHAGWPYHKETAYLAALFDNVYIDLSLMIPFVSTAITPALTEIFGFVPFDKILFATDAFVLPEIYWIAVKTGKKAISEVFNNLYQQNILSASEIDKYAYDIFYNNSKKLYLNER